MEKINRNDQITHFIIQKTEQITLNGCLQYYKNIS